MTKTRTPSTKAAAAVLASAAPSTAPIGGSGVSASAETGGTAPSGDVASQLASAGIATATTEGDASLAPVAGAKAGEGPELVIDPPSGIDATVAPASASTAASVADILGASSPSAATVAASLAAPVVPANGAALAGTVTTDLGGFPAAPAATDDLRAEDAFAGDFTGRVIRVRSVSDRGRRRAGFGFSPTPQRIEVDELTTEELIALVQDPQLVVTIDD